MPGSMSLLGVCMPVPMSLPGNVYTRSQVPSKGGIVMSRRSQYVQGGGVGISEGVSILEG